MESLLLTGGDLFNNNFDESLLKTEERIDLRHTSSLSQKGCKIKISDVGNKNSLGYVVSQNHNPR